MRALVVTILSAVAAATLGLTLLVGCASPAQPVPPTETAYSVAASPSSEQLASLPPTASPTVPTPPTVTPSPVPTDTPQPPAIPTPEERRGELASRGGPRPVEQEVQEELPPTPAPPPPTATAMATATRVPPPPPPPPTPVPPPTATPVPVVQEVAHSAESRFSLDLLNSARAAHGVPPLALDGTISIAAERHAVEMAQHNYLGHTNRQGQQPWDRMRAAGAQFGAAGENLGRAWVGDGSPEPGIRAMHDMMMAETPPDDGHRVNVLNRSYRRVGIGFARLDGNLYWVCDFAD
jgi:uncharacterized protein YkwD